MKYQINPIHITELLKKSNDILQDLHPSLITTPSSRNNIHLTALTIISNGEHYLL